MIRSIKVRVQKFKFPMLFLRTAADRNAHSLEANV